MNVEEREIHVDVSPDNDSFQIESNLDLLRHEKQKLKIQTWSDEKVELLQLWADKAVGYRWLHEKARKNYKKLHDNLSYPTIIINTISGVGSFAIINTENTDNEDQSQSLLFFRYMFAFFNVIGSILHAISKFNNSLELSERHSHSSVEYSKFYRHIQMELSLEKENRQSALKFISSCRKTYDKLLTTAPPIPESCIKSFNSLFPDRKSKPDVCNGLNMID